MNPFRVATQDDVDVIADLIQEKRLQYEHYQPIFWRVAPSARDNHLGFLAKVVARFAHTLASLDALDSVYGMMVDSDMHVSFCVTSIGHKKKPFLMLKLTQIPTSY